MTGLADVDGFKICFQDWVLPGFRPLTMALFVVPKVIYCVLILTDVVWQGLGEHPMLLRFTL